MAWIQVFLSLSWAWIPSSASAGGQGSDGPFLPDAEGTAEVSNCVADAIAGFRIVSPGSPHNAPRGVGEEASRANTGSVLQGFHGTQEVQQRQRDWQAFAREHNEGYQPISAGENARFISLVQAANEAYTHGEPSTVQFVSLRFSALRTLNNYGLKDKALIDAFFNLVKAELRREIQVHPELRQRLQGSFESYKNIGFAFDWRDLSPEQRGRLEGVVAQILQRAQQSAADHAQRLGLLNGPLAQLAGSAAHPELWFHGGVAPTFSLADRMARQSEIVGSRLGTPAPGQRHAPLPPQRYESSASVVSEAGRAIDQGLVAMEQARDRVLNHVFSLPEVQGVVPGGTNPSGGVWPSTILNGAFEICSTCGPGSSRRPTYTPSMELMNEIRRMGTAVSGDLALDRLAEGVRERFGWSLDPARTEHQQILSDLRRIYRETELNEPALLVGERVSVDPLLNSAQHEMGTFDFRNQGPRNRQGMAAALGRVRGLGPRERQTALDIGIHEATVLMRGINEHALFALERALGATAHRMGSEGQTIQLRRGDQVVAEIQFSGDDGVVSYRQTLTSEQRSRIAREIAQPGQVVGISPTRPGREALSADLKIRQLQLFASQLGLPPSRRSGEALYFQPPLNEAQILRLRQRAAEQGLTVFSEVTGAGSIRSTQVPADALPAGVNRSAFLVACEDVSKSMEDFVRPTPGGFSTDEVRRVGLLTRVTRDAQGAPRVDLVVHAPESLRTHPRWPELQERLRREYSRIALPSLMQGGTVQRGQVVFELQ